MLKKIFGFKNLLDSITLENIQNKLCEMGFNQKFVEEIMNTLEERSNIGNKKFQEWFYKLNYRLPEEFKDEVFAIKLYDNHRLLIEGEVKKLEKEMNLSWEKQAEDLIDSHEKARKVQLVIRHRLSDIALDLLS
ncbi:hypothetical protein H1D32_07920 [Anaerobacillus sp. CMMVII]|uniref:hypothetical protein n=1 Tax=Anaerobacillus sp. CMMVII TaxID=2755588 RepID=UPI0021B7F2A7|nr:hypothetical protein [Anaerobacillus sp. CMMVII]MCT8137689.1 hypothetical protein [Anaerobacillus sp. CMMVII]